MNKKSIRIATIVVAIIILLMIFTACSTSLADTLHSFSPNDTADVTLDKKGCKFQSEAGIRQEKGQLNKLAKLMINQEFLEAYVEEYGLLDLLEHYNGYLSCAINESDFETYSDSFSYIDEINDRDNQIRSGIMSLPEYKSLDTILINAEELGKLHGSMGYYDGKEDEIIEGDKVTGEFNDINHDNKVYEDSRTNRSEKKYYGDWEVDFTVNYSYNPGKYGWNDGVFEDELAHFEYNSTVDVFYKGDLFANYVNVFPQDISIECKVIDGKVFHWQDCVDRPGAWIKWVDNYTPDEDAVGIKIDDAAVCGSLAGNRYTAVNKVSDDGTTAEFYIDFYSDGTCKSSNNKHDDDETEVEEYEVRAIGTYEYAIDTANLGHKETLFYKDEYKFKVTGIEGNQITEFTQETLSGERVFKLDTRTPEPEQEDEVKEDEASENEDDGSTGSTGGGGISASGNDIGRYLDIEN